LNLYVSTTAATYTFAIYRMGWYAGRGARQVYTSNSLQGIKQPEPRLDPATRTVSCDNWRAPVRIAIPSQWVSGVYVIKLVSSEGYMRYTLFVVRNDTSRAAILVQLSFFTYQAYNQYGGYSLYRGLKSGLAAAPAGTMYDDPNVFVPERRSYAVSFDRPYY